VDCPRLAFALELDLGIWVIEEVQPPGRLALAPAVHRHRHDVRAVLEVGDDRLTLLAGAAPDGH
jgi:hypothetical protein